MTYQRKELGQSGEEIAADFLIEQKGYKILDRNLHLRIGEIDILAQENNTIIIVEVKTKRYIRQGLPEEMVNYHKQKKLIQLSRAISQQYPNQPIRIDVIAVDETKHNPWIKHFINAVEG